jgi:hypothetical protein
LVAGLLQVASGLVLVTGKTNTGVEGWHHPQSLGREERMRVKLANGLISHAFVMKTSENPKKMRIRELSDG